MSMKGGCLCGAVRYEASDPVVTAICHCTNCQKTSGAAYSVNLLFPADKVRFSGKVQSYVDHGDSGGKVMRHFCPVCGSSLYTLADTLPGLTIIKAGSLDDTSAVRPTVQLYCARAQEWLPEIPGTAKHALAMQ
jgi:hypothetical protein